MESRRRNPPRAARPAAAPPPASAASLPRPAAPLTAPAAPPPARLLFSAHRPPAPSRASAVTAEIPRPTPNRLHSAIAAEIVRPHTDERWYRHIILPNSMSCVLVSDPETDKMAVALNVRTGYFTDPDGLEGLSQFIEKSLVHGNPSLSNFMDVLSKNNGYMKALTLAERTSFSVDGSSTLLPAILKGFANLFLEPSICCTDQNLLDINSGDVKQSKINQLHRYLCDADHPYTKFKYENLLSFIEKLKKNSVVKDGLVSLYQSRFSSNLMTLVVYGKEDLDDLQLIVQETFSGIKNYNANTPSSSHCPCTKKFWQIIVKTPSENEIQSLRIEWPLNRTISNREEADAVTYLVHVFGYKSEGTLYHLLKHDEKWILNYRVSETGCEANFSFFSIEVELTESGVEHYGEICDLVFQYISVLKKARSRKSRFEELQRFALDNFNCGPMNNPIEIVDQMASNMLIGPPSDCLMGHLPSTYSEPAIRSIINMLTKDRIRIFLSSSKFKGQTSSTEPVYGTPYSIEAIPLSSFQEWANSAPKKKLSVPTEICNEVASHKAVSEKASTFHSEELKGTKGVPINEKACVCVIYDERMMRHKSPDSEHDERPSRIQAIFKRLKRDGLLRRCKLYSAERASLKYLVEAHSDLHILRIIKGDVSEWNYYSDGSEDAIFLAAGGAIKACDMVASGMHRYGFAVIRPPGHHASKNKDSGFCYFNNIALGAKYLIKEYNMQRIMIIDWDFHFGDGTSEIFIRDKSVLFVSLHRTGYFPYNSDDWAEHNIGRGEGKGYNLNICWPAPVNDHDLYAVFDHLILPIAKDYDPEIILVSAGFDAALGDNIGDCHLSPIGYGTLLKKLMRLGKGIVLVLEGGYNLDVTSACVSSCIKVLSGDNQMIEEVEYTPLKSTWQSIQKARKLHEPLFSSLRTDIPHQFLAREIDKHSVPREVT